MKEEKFRLYEEKNEIEIFNINIKYIIGKLNKIIDIMNVYYEIIIFIFIKYNKIGY